MKISYAITAHNEFDEIQKLINILKSQLNSVSYDYEIIILDDYSSHPSMIAVLNDLAGKGVRNESHKLNNNFAEHKNFLSSLCKGDIIFQLDADEIPANRLIQGIASFFLANPDVEVFNVPRVNIVNGITDKHIKQWGWKVSSTPQYKRRERVNVESLGYTLLQENDLIMKQDQIIGSFAEVEYMLPIINWPDLQKRMWRNLSSIRWEDAVHETLVGWKTIGTLPLAMEFSILHEKEIQKQEQQNAMYSRIPR